MQTIEAQVLTLRHYADKGIYAYICPLTIGGPNGFERGDFINGEVPLDRENATKYYAGKSVDVEIVLDVPDGYYEFKQASEARSVFGYLHIENGQIIEEWTDRKLFLAAMQEKVLEDGDIELPNLQGSDRQIEWAISIRQKALLKITGEPNRTIPEIFTEQISAKWWIENRDDLEQE